MPTAKQKKEDMVTVNKEEYEALLHVVKVTKEYLEGKGKNFDSAESLIKNLRGL